MAGCVSPIRVTLDRAGEEEAAPNYLARFHFSAEGSEPASGPDRMLALPTVDGRAVCEQWQVAAPVEHEARGGFKYSFGGGYAVISWSGARSGSIRTQAREVYGALLPMTRELGYESIVKLWNYVPEINRGEGDCEVYRQFCLGRGQIFDDLWGARVMPAGTAVGAPAGAPLQIILLAQGPGVSAVENPRQTSAYHYPKQYGPHSPSFSRGAIAASDQLFVSGTASIVGHESRHAGCLGDEIAETGRNWQVLLQQAAKQHSGPAHHAARTEALRVYLRDPDAYAEAADALSVSGFPANKALFLAADICRRELLFEIDGVIGYAAKA